MTSTHRKPIASRAAITWSRQDALCLGARSRYAIRPAGRRASSALPQQPRRTLSHHPSPAPTLHETCHAFLEARCAAPVRRSLAAAPLRHRRNHLHKHPPAFASRKPIASQHLQSQCLLTVAALGISHRPLPVFLTHPDAWPLPAPLADAAISQFRLLTPNR
jgi:hypothetical protein